MLYTYIHPKIKGSVFANSVSVATLQNTTTTNNKNQLCVHEKEWEIEQGGNFMNQMYINTKEKIRSH